MTEEQVEEKSNTASNAPISDLKGIGFVGKAVGILVMIWLVSISYYAFAFFALGMLPAIVAIVVDRGAGRFASKTVFACNFVGILPFLFDIGLAYERSIAAKQLMVDPFTWLVMYGFAAIGWILIWILPQITLIIYTIRADVNAKKLHKDQESLLDEWGDEVKTGAKR